MILAGGERYLLPAGIEGRHGKGMRTDGLNLVERAEELGYTIVYTRDELLALDASTIDKVLSLFAAGDTFDAEGNGTEYRSHYLETAPSIAEMADFALQVVSRDPTASLP